MPCPDRLFELQEHGQSQIAGEALERIAALYAIEQAAHELDADARQALRETKAKRLLEDLKAWLLACRSKIPSGSSSAKRRSTTP
ncbi:MAG: transposase [Zoogloea sp.]|uniref:IS66 family transposase n=1 Tax=Zoogloea sp. TaxID=49181 RepID=UPI002624222E|nr:transposase [Zoogloea sp.]MDD3329268.1 transposase [Zoogloea sp.]